MNSSTIKVRISQCEYMKITSIAYECMSRRVYHLGNPPSPYTLMYKIHEVPNVVFQLIN